MTVNITEILEMFDSNMTPQAIADELEISVTTVRTTLKAQGREIVRSIRRPDEDDIIRAYAEGIEVGEILRGFKISHTVLYTVLGRNSVELRKTTEAPTKLRLLDRAVEMYEEGWTLWKIKQETGIAQPTLHNELHDRAIPLRRPRKQ